MCLISVILAFLYACGRRQHLLLQIIKSGMECFLLYLSCWCLFRHKPSQCWNLLLSGSLAGHALCSPAVSDNSWSVRFPPDLTLTCQSEMWNLNPTQPKILTDSRSYSGISYFWSLGYFSPYKYTARCLQSIFSNYKDYCIHINCFLPHPHHYRTPPDRPDQIIHWTRGRKPQATCH